MGSEGYLEGSGGANTEGLVLLHNRGVVSIEGAELALAGRRASAPAHARPEM